MDIFYLPIVQIVDNCSLYQGNKTGCIHDVITTIIHEYRHHYHTWVSPLTMDPVFILTFYIVAPFSGTIRLGVPHHPVRIRVSYSSYITINIFTGVVRLTESGLFFPCYNDTLCPRFLSRLFFVFFNHCLYLPGGCAIHFVYWPLFDHLICWLQLRLAIRNWPLHRWIKWPF